MNGKLAWALAGAAILAAVELVAGAAALTVFVVARLHAAPQSPPGAIVITSPTPASYAGRFHELPIPAPGGTPYALSVDRDGSVWFTEAECTSGIGRRSKNGQWDNWPITGDCKAQPLALTQGSDGNLWFADVWGYYGRVTPDGQLTRFQLPDPAYAMGITTGPDGNLWLAAASGQQKPYIAEISTLGFVIAEFPINPKYGEARGIVTGPDGALWFTRSNAIGRITTGGALTEFPMPEGTGSGMPYQITAGRDRNLWFVEYLPTGDGRIGRMTTAGRLTEYATPGVAGLQWITVGPDNALWFTGRGAIGRITTSGAVTSYQVPTSRAQPVGITTGPDGNMWFSENFGDNTGKLGIFSLK